MQYFPPYSIDNIENNVMEDYLCLLFLKDDVTYNAKLIKREINKLIINFANGMTCVKRLEQNALIQSIKNIDTKLKHYNAKKRLNKFKILYNFRRHNITTNDHYGKLNHISYEHNGEFYSENTMGFECTSCMMFCGDNVEKSNHSYNDRKQCKYCLLLMCGLCSYSDKCKFCIYEIKSGIIAAKLKTINVNKTGLKIKNNNNIIN